MLTGITQRDIVLEFYQNNPDRLIRHPEIVDWVTSEYKKRTGKVFRDPDRQIRSLHQEGYLDKIKNGVYRYNPNPRERLPDFTQNQKDEILVRDGYKCVVCGKDEADGEVLHIDHIRPRDKGGKSTTDNGQVLCSAHNFRKKNYNQTETAKRLFINLLNRSEKNSDFQLADFCKDILSVYDKHDINGHIEWPKS